MPAQAVEAEFGRTDAHPVTAPDQAGLARDGPVGVGNADADGGAEVGPVRAFVELHEHGEAVAGAARLALVLGDRRGRRRGDFAGQAKLDGIARHHAALENLLGARQGRQPRGDVSRGEHFRRRQRGAALL